MCLGVCVAHVCMSACVYLCIQGMYMQHICKYTCITMYVGYCYTIFIIMQMLVGTYQCTGVPGEFDWKPGILTRVSVNDTIMYYCL